MAQIFISYKRIDKDKVFPIVEKIEHELGCDCWVDLEGIESSVQFASVICSAIDKSDVILFMHSSAHLTIDFETDWTVKELNYAHAKKKRVVLVKLDDTPLDNIFLMEYGSKNNIDLQDPTQFNKLLNDLRSWLHLPHPKSASQFDAMCPCGSGKLFKDCHGRTVTPLEKTWKVGDYYNVDGKEGVVFWVDKTGRHGKIVSLDETELQWFTGVGSRKIIWCSTDAVFKEQPVAVDLVDGMLNLKAVMGNYLWREEYPAFAWCADHGDGWYLPAINELSQLISVKNKLKRKINGEYWSSTEDQDGNVLCFDATIACSKSFHYVTHLNVCAVSKF